MRRGFGILAIGLFFIGCAFAQFTFHLIDNFESGKPDKWWKFGDIRIECSRNATAEARDMVAQSCGDYSLKIRGKTFNWYVGGAGTYLALDASPYSRLQFDLYGSSSWGGKIRAELFDDDNRNYNLEQNLEKNYEPVNDDKWTAEINILGPGFTRVSVPFSAFKDANPAAGDNLWNPDQKDGSGGLLQLQFVLIGEQEKSEIDLAIDNVLLTY